MKKHSAVLIVILFCFINQSSYSGSFKLQEKFFRPGINFGIGLPKVPLGRYHTPISICGGLVIYFKITHRIAFHTSGNGLYTFNLGSVLQDDSRLKFNLIWSNICLDYKIKTSMNAETYVSPGFGYYSLYQQFENDTDNLATSGFNLGIVTNTFKRNHISQFEIRWHLLFNPQPKPQVLTVNFGFLL